MMKLLKETNYKAFKELEQFRLYDEYRHDYIDNRHTLASYRFKVLNNIIFDLIGYYPGHHRARKGEPGISSFRF